VNTKQAMISITVNTITEQINGIIIEELYEIDCDISNGDTVAVRRETHLIIE